MRWRRSLTSFPAGLLITMLLAASPPSRAQQLPQGTPSPATGGAAETLAAPSAQSALAPGAIPQPTVAYPGMVAGVSVGEIYTNNVNLAGAGQAKQSSFITTVTPFFRAAHSGPRFSGMIDYSLSAYLYRGQKQTSQVAQRLHGAGTLTLIPNHFFVDGVAGYDRQIINNQLPSGGSAYFINRNQANVARGILSPYWVQDLGTLGTMTMRYSRGRVAYSDRGIPGESPSLLSGISNVTSNGMQFVVQSPKQGFWRWNLSYAKQRIEPDSGPGTEFAAAKFGLGLQVSRELELLADVGKENKFLPDGTVQGLGASFWDAGFRWANALDTFRVLAGHHYYGPSYSVTWIHQAARIMTMLNYREVTTDVNQTLLTSNVAQALILPLTVPRLTSLNEVNPYLSKRGTFSITYMGARDRLTMTAYDELRTFLTLNNEDERVFDVRAGWQYDLGAFTTLTPTLGWRRYRFRSGQTNYALYSKVALIHQFSASDSGIVAISHRTNRVTSPVPGARGYVVNAIEVEWTHLF